MISGSYIKRAQGGFTLLEVMIAVLILGIGLLGFALLQTKSVNFARSSNQRTQAINLAADLLDQMRSNRLLAAQYQAASFTGGTSNGVCSRANSNGIATSIARWQCQVRATLGPGSTAVVTYNAGQATVRVTWDDQYAEGAGPRTQNAYTTGLVDLGTRL